MSGRRQGFKTASAAYELGICASTLRSAIYALVASETKAGHTLRLQVTRLPYADEHYGAELSQVLDKLQQTLVPLSGNGRIRPETVFANCGVDFAVYPEYKLAW